MKNSLPFFVGTYTQMITEDFGGSGEGIHSMTLNTLTGELKQQYCYPCRNPSYMTLSPCGTYIYTINEVDQDACPQVIGFQVQADLRLKKINSQPIEGAFPCHIACYQKFILVACYGSGNLACYPLESSGLLGSCQYNFHHRGSSINSQRQKSPHAHQVIQHPTKPLIHVPDLGIDQVKAYSIRGAEILINETHDLKVTPGSGPRHMVYTLSCQQVFVLNELTGIISCFDTTEEGYKLISEIPSLPDNFTGEPSASAIRIHPNGRYLYVGNRHFEAITVFEITEKGPELRSYISTKGKTLREFNLTPDGNWLIAAHQDSHNLIVYRLLDDGLVFKKQSEYPLQSPVCIVF